MSHELLPCPFCGGDANAKPHSQHLPGCYFDAMASLKAAPKGDLSMAPEVIRAWNRRATQPAAGEPMAEFFVDLDTLRKALSIYGLAAPVSNEELGLQMDRQAVRVIEAVARLPFPYPPAAAHGDEAVQKDAERYRYLRDSANARLAAGPAIGMANADGSLVLRDNGAEMLLGREEADAAIDAAMRAQGDGHD